MKPSSANPRLRRHPPRRRGGHRRGRRAFDEGPWPRTPERERGALLLRTADLLERDADAFARAESLDTGKLLVESEYDIADVVSCFRYHGGLGGTDAGRVIDTGRDDAVSRVVYEPVGVCARSGSPAYDLVKKFNWTNDDQNTVAKYIAVDKMAPEAAAKKWVDANRGKVDAWIKQGAGPPV